mgnify:CR=1 FL=1
MSIKKIETPLEPHQESDPRLKADQSNTQDKSEPHPTVSEDNSVTSGADEAPSINWSYTQFAWAFLRLNAKFIEQTDKALNRSDKTKASLAKKWGLKRFKHHAEPFNEGKKPRFSSSSVSFWSNTEEKHGKYRSVSRRLRKGHVFIQFDLEQAVSLPNRSIKAQLSSAEEILSRLIEKYQETSTLKEGIRPTISLTFERISLVGYYNFYVAAKRGNQTNLSAFLENLPAIFSPEQKRKSLSDPQTLKKDADKAMRKAKDLIERDYLKLAVFEN